MKKHEQLNFENHLHALAIWSDVIMKDHADEGFNDLERLKNNLAVLQDMVRSTVKKYSLIRRKTHNAVMESNWKHIEQDLEEIYGQ